MTTQTNATTGSINITKSAKDALERVCSGAGLDPASRYYSPTFVDHVNDLVFHGLAGAQRSVDLYKSALSDTRIEVEEQTIDGNRVVSRFVVTGVSYGRRVQFNGITISRFEDGLIVEDWSITDTLSMLRQLGVWRSVLLGIRQWRSLRGATASTGEARVQPRANGVAQSAPACRST
jgi:predicted ester cyclase